MDNILPVTNINKINIQRRKVYFSVDLNDFEDESIFLNYIGEYFERNIDILSVIPSLLDTKNIKWLKKVRELCSVYDCLFLIENRIDIARLIEADGIFLNEKGFSVIDAKKISEGLIIGTNQTNTKDVDFFVSNEVLKTDLPCFVIDKTLSQNKKYKYAVKITE